MSLSVPLLASDAFSACPICKQGHLVDSAKLADDPHRPSRNLEVWSRAADCLAIGEKGGQICTNCWYVSREGSWLRSSEQPDDFYRPLSYAISTFPMPRKSRIKGRAIYEQKLLGSDGAQGFVETLRFWSVKSNEYVAAIQKHAEAHSIEMTLEEHPSEPGEIYVVAEIEGS
ncbi:hypothetical protein [Lysobacter antibioticus]|nr:hypothetical protein [Lysobacter antibioticus]